MSATNPARPRSSRRAFLSTGAAAIALTGAVAAPALASPSDLAEAALCDWLAIIGAYNSVPHGRFSDPAEQAEWGKVKEAERVLYDLPPSPMAAAAIALLEINYLMGHEEAVLDTGDADTERQLFRIVTHLRPSLIGRLAVVAGDLVDNPGRPFGESLLCRAIDGEA